MCLKTADLIELQASKIFIRQPEKKDGNCWTKSLGRSGALDRADYSAPTGLVARTVCPANKVLHLTLIINMYRAHGYICNVSRLCDGNVG